MSASVSFFDPSFRDWPDEAIASEAASAAVLLDTGCRITDITRDAAAILGCTPEQLRGRTLIDLAADGWRAAAESVTVHVRSGATESRELMLRGRSGRRELVQIAARRVAANERGQDGYVMAWVSQHARSLPAAAQNPREAELRRLSYGLLSTQEAERSRVASELHGGVAPLVIMIKFMVEDALQRLVAGAHSQAAEVLVNATGRLRDVISEVRRISTELRPSVLDDLGLLPTIEWFCRTFEETYHDIHVERLIVVHESEIARPLKLEIFRIIQESLANVAQHAQAAKVRVALVRDRKTLKLWIEDDGVGFDADRMQQESAGTAGVGLQSIRKRVDGTGGRLIVQSRPREGALIGAAWRLTPNDVASPKQAH